MKTKLEYPEPRTNTKRTNRIIGNFQDKFNSLLTDQKLPLSMLVNILGYGPILGVPIEASIFRRLDYCSNFEMLEDAQVLGGALKQIKDGYITLGIRRLSINSVVMQINLVRALRPKRVAQKKTVLFNTPFDPKSFHYGMPQCDIEVFYSLQEMDNLTIDLLLNRYPFAPYHFLWVPDRKGEHRQFIDLQRDMVLLEAAYELVVGEGPKGSLRLCYNSMGAHASVNHLHFQGFVITPNWEPPFDRFIQMYIEKAGNTTGIVPWYLKGTQWISPFDGVNGLKDFIARMNANEQPYHLYITPYGVACFPRKHQGDDHYYQLLARTEFTTGFAFFEMLGEIVSPTAEVLYACPHCIDAMITKLYDALSTV